jgi:hypothetical protein
MAKNKLPTLKEIESLKSDFTSELKNINKEEKEGKSSPKRVFLSSISKEIKESIESGTSYVGVKRAIKKIYMVDVSTQIISDFAHLELGIPKRKKAENSLLKNESVQAMKKRIANEPHKEGDLSL